MGALLNRLYEVLEGFSTGKPSAILMLGLDGAGKTTILYKVKLNETVQTIPTIGFNVETVTPAPGVTFTVWDIAGQYRIRALYRNYFENSEGLLFVVDASDRERIEEARDELFNIITYESMSSVPFVVIANKSDLSMAIPITELIQQLNLHSISRQRWYIQSACAITGDGLVEAMQQLSKMIKDNKKTVHN
ncbi:hypothetical protein I4U23_020776 [Adineta vaga]|nr:hypothetical protein I4U23_020776 [Adineta vaga]